MKKSCAICTREQGNHKNVKQSCPYCLRSICGSHMKSKACSDCAVILSGVGVNNYPWMADHIEHLQRRGRWSELLRDSLYTDEKLAS